MRLLPNRLSLAVRLFLALFGMSGVMVALIVSWAGWALDTRFAAYVGAAALARMDPAVVLLQQEYAAHGDWSSLAGQPTRWETLLRQGEPRLPPGSQLAGPFRDEPPPDGPPHDGPPHDGPPHDGPPHDGPPHDSPLPDGLPHDSLGQAGPPPDMPLDTPPRPRLDRGARPTMQLHFHPSHHLTLLDAAGRIVVGPPPYTAHGPRRPIIVAGKRVGALVFDAGPLPGGIEAAFLAERTRDLYAGGGVALLLSLVVALLLARSILAPVKSVAAGARRLATGDFATRLATDRDDELGDLVRDFNRLAASLEASEQARRLWVADTSHELRTPLAVLRAQIEAMQDGVHTVGPVSLAKLHEEVLRMTKLVADLHELARADSQALALHCERVNPGALMAEMLAGFTARREEQGLTLEADGLGRTTARVLADPDRLCQVFGNLVENTIRYTDRGGTIVVTEHLSAASIDICIEDTAPAVAAANLPRLFERFFRVETSRSRGTGGSGLGLAICRAIVEAHAGTITAAASSRGGLAVTVSLPTMTGPA